MEEKGDIFQAPERPVDKSKVRLVPDVYFLPRRSIPRTIALYAFLTAAGVGAGMVVEQWIKKQLQRKDTRHHFVVMENAELHYRYVGADDTADSRREKEDTETKQT